MMPLRFAIPLVALAVASSTACAGREAPAAQPQARRSDSAQADTTSGGIPSASPIVDSIAEALVFVPRNQTWFTAAARGKRMLLDLGRVDLEVRRDSARAAHYRALVAGRAPIRAGARLRLHGPWGSDDATVTGFDTWNGRIVAVLAVPARVDSLVKRIEPLPAAAVRNEQPAESAGPPCSRDSVTLAHAQRLDALRDSVEQALRTSVGNIPYERLADDVVVRTTLAHGCFAGGRTVMLSSLRAGSFEYVRERAYLIADDGGITPLRFAGSPWRAHEAIYALDADGDGTDDLAVRGSSNRAGGTVIFTLNGNRLARLTGGFNWESR
jgi:hypothetical protein